MTSCTHLGGRCRCGRSSSLRGWRCGDRGGSCRYGQARESDCGQRRDPKHKRLSSRRRRGHSAGQGNAREAAVCGLAVPHLLWQLIAWRRWRQRERRVVSLCRLWWRRRRRQCTCSSYIFWTVQATSFCSSLMVLLADQDRAQSTSAIEVNTRTAGSWFEPATMYVYLCNSAVLHLTWAELQQKVQAAVVPGCRLLRRSVGTVCQSESGSAAEW